VFLAEAGDRIVSLTLAENAIVIAAATRQVGAASTGGATHEFNRLDPNHYSVTQFGQSDLPIEVTGLLPSTERL